MDDHTPKPTCVLQLNLSCCNSCPKKIKKALLKIDGVYSVTIDIEKGQVTVSGKVDPMVLIKLLAKRGKSAELLSYDDKEDPMDDQKKNKDKGKCKNKEFKEEKCCQNDKKKHVPSKEKGHDCCAHDDNSNNNVPPPDNFDVPRSREIVFDENVCRDIHCRIHNRRFFIQNDRMPRRDAKNTHAHYNWQNPLQNPSYRDGYIDTNRYGYQHQGVEPIMYNRPLPPRGYGYYMQRPISMADGFTHFFSDENTRACSIM